MAAAAATATAIVSQATVSAAGRRGKERVVTGLSSFGGLKAQNTVTSLGVSVNSEQAFHKVVCSLRSQGKSKGGAFTAQSNAAGEIFRIAAIMNGLVLIGVAVGFVLLRIEASLEEAE